MIGCSFSMPSRLKPGRGDISIGVAVVVAHLVRARLAPLICTPMWPRPSNCVPTWPISVARNSSLPDHLVGAERAAGRAAGDAQHELAVAESGHGAGVLPPSRRPCRSSASASARSTTSGLLYQLVEPASSAAPHSLFGHHLSPSGVSIELPMTHGLPLQAFQFLSEHSCAKAAPQTRPVSTSAAPSFSFFFIVVSSFVVCGKNGNAAVIGWPPWQAMAARCRHGTAAGPRPAHGSGRCCRACRPRQFASCATGGVPA